MHLGYQTARAVLEGQFFGEDRRWRKLLDYYFTCIHDCETHPDQILFGALKLTDKTIVVFITIMVN